LYESIAVPNKSDPKFINSVISIETNYSAEQLMHYIFEVEKNFERKREQLNAPRTCDIDIVDFNGEVININNTKISLQIPHPRLEQRSFVLYPISEIDKNWQSPLSGKRIDQLIEDLDLESKKSITII
jgi:2-amino-4-hydroxy-6-hydroxymethyldihydropteridine diphosphokinase